MSGKLYIPVIQLNFMMEIEKIMRQIDELQLALGAEKTIELSRGHYEEREVIDYPEETGRGHGMTTWDYAAGDSFLPRHKEQVYVPDTQNIPDNERRVAARTELNRIYANSNSPEIRKRIEGLVAEIHRNP